MTTLAESPKATAVLPAARFKRLRSYVSLTKPRIVELLLVTTVPAMMLAEGGLPPLGLIAVVLVGGSLAAGGSSAINCYLDRDIDPLMGRTARRPLATQVIAPHQALIFGLILAAVSVAIMAVFTNPLATGLTVAAIVYYDVIYTAWLKRTTKHNTFWGGVCGAMPVLIGWASVTGSLAPLAWLLFGVVFFWQMPHFYALAIRFRDDYARAGIPMLPVVATPLHVVRDAVVYAWLTVACSLAAWLFTGAGESGEAGLSTIYGVPALVCGGMLIFEAHGLYLRTAKQGGAASPRYRRDSAGASGPCTAPLGGTRPGRGDKVSPMRLFHWTNAYLTIVFVAAAVDVFI